MGWNFTGPVKNLLFYVQKGERRDMAHAPSFGGDPRDVEIRDIHTNAGYFYTMAMNECLTSHPERIMLRHLDMWQIQLFVSLERFWFCLSGLKKSIYYGVYGWEAEDYLREIYDPWRLRVEDRIEEMGYRANVFMVMEEDAKQMGVIFSPGGEPKCTPEELAEEINALGQQVYEEKVFKGHTRYCNVTALSEELHGYPGIREGFLQTRKLNNLSYFRMEPGVVTARRVAEMRNGADYRIVIGECHQLQEALDQGDTGLCRRRLEDLFLGTVKGAYRWTLLHDALSYCKHMLELRCTARGLEGVVLEELCDPESYLRIEECVEALWPVLEKLCALVREQGPYQDLMLRAVYYIKLHYAEDLALPDVARYANVNPNYLSGAFQKEMGISLREFITAQRMEAAKRLLAGGDLRVQDVAEAVGVHDVKYFSRLFKKAAGCTPGEYKLKAKN